MDKDGLLECPRAKSDMTPCYLRDGDLAVAKREICVGCEVRIDRLQDERAAALRASKEQQDHE